MKGRRLWCFEKHIGLTYQTDLRGIIISSEWKVNLSLWNRKEEMELLCEHLLNISRPYRNKCVAYWMPLYYNDCRSGTIRSTSCSTCSLRHASRGCINIVTNSVWETNCSFTTRATLASKKPLLQQTVDHQSQYLFLCINRFLCIRIATV